jgi:hypothetical protein
VRCPGVGPRQRGRPVAVGLGGGGGFCGGLWWVCSVVLVLVSSAVCCVLAAGVRGRRPSGLKR